MNEVDYSSGLPAPELKIEPLRVLVWPSNRLREKSVPVFAEDVADPDFRRFVKRLEATLLRYRGVGLSAIQVGVAKRVFVMRTRDGVQVFVNPVVMKTFDKPVEVDEGCLSVPGYTTRALRYAEVIVASTDLDTGVEKLWQLEGEEAQCAQHEIDHFEGLVFPDKFGLAKRDAVKRAVRKALATDERYL